MQDWAFKPWIIWHYLQAGVELGWSVGHPARITENCSWRRKTPTHFVTGSVRSKVFCVTSKRDSQERNPEGKTEFFLTQVKKCLWLHFQRQERPGYFLYFYLPYWQTQPEVPGTLHSALQACDCRTHTTALWDNHATIIIPEWNEWMKKPKPQAFKYLFQDNQLVSDKGALNLYAFNLCALLTFSLSHDSQHSPEGWCVFLIQT